MPFGRKAEQQRHQERILGEQERHALIHFILRQDGNTYTTEELHGMSLSAIQNIAEKYKPSNPTGILTDLAQLRHDGRSWAIGPHRAGKRGASRRI